MSRRLLGVFGRLPGAFGRLVGAFGMLLAMGFTLLIVLPGTGMLQAQDRRTVNTPVFPASCAVLPAELSIVHGGPSSETQFDTSRLQQAMDSCTPGEAVELVSSGSNHAFLIQPITIPSGVTLLIDAGVTVYASRNPADYQKPGNVETCGTVGTQGNGCMHLISDVGSITGSGIMGYGIIDGRGGDKLLVDGEEASYSWWDLGAKAYTTTPYGVQNNPVLIWMAHASNFTLYKITLKNSPLYHFLWTTSATGLTVWDAKIIAPFTAANTDGIDVGNSVSDVTIENSYISNGDDQIAIDADAGWPVSHITVSHLHTYSGRGVSIGSSTAGGVTDVVVDSLDQEGNSNDVNGNGFRIKSAADRGGVVQNILYENICQQNERYPFRFDPFYVATSSTAFIPAFRLITLRNVTILKPTSATLPSDLWLQGYDGAHATTATFDNVVVDDTPVYVPTPEHFHMTVGPGPVEPASLLGLKGTVTYKGAAGETSEAPYPCSASNFIELIGELFLSTPSETNQQSITVAKGASFSLNAVVQAASAEFPAPTSGITFYEGSNPVGTSALIANGTLAKVTFTKVSPGTHTYTARYPGDSFFPAYSLGSLTVTVE